MAARVLLLSILFTEVLRPACLAGVKGTSSSAGGFSASRSEILELEKSGGLGVRLETEPSRNVVVGRRGATLRCAAGANQKVFWLRNGVAAPPCGPARCIQLFNGSLHFYKMNQKSRDRESLASGSDKIQRNEWYRCVAKSTVGLLRSLPALLQIADLSREFDESPNDVIVYEEEIARLSCFIHSVPFPPNITWQRDGQPLSFVNKTKYFMVSPGVLYINSTKQSDAGSYRCIATNEFLRKSRKSKEAKLRVAPKLEEEKSNVPVTLFPQSSYNYQLIAGSDLKLVCAASGFPSLIRWIFISQHKDGVVVTKPRVLLNTNGSIAVLKLKNIKAGDTGVYQCSVENAGVTLQIQNITIEVLIPPTFLKKPVNQRHPNGKTARFECQAQGVPTPQIYWLKDSVNLTSNPREKTYMRENNKMELAIASTVPSDSGIYQCVAVNAAGEAWAAGRLQVATSLQSPPVPTSLNCHALSSDKIFLSWKPPHMMLFSNVTSYITVHYALTASGSREDIVLPDQNSSFIEIESLQPFTNYTMYVRMWNVHGASNQSATIQCSTAASGMATNDDRIELWNRFVPIAAPSITVNPISSTKLHVSWLPLSKEEARGFVVEYKLQWRLEDHPSAKVRNLSSSVNQHVLTDLIPGTRYEVRVLARTRQGWPNVSDSRFNWTSVLMPLTDSSQSPFGQLVEIDVVNINASAVKIKWKINKETTKSETDFDSWQLYCQDEAGKRLLTIFLPKNSTEHLFTEFAEATHEIGLCMIHSGQSSICSLRQLKSKSLIAGNALTELEGVPASSTSINITWSTAPLNTKRCYEVCYNAVHFADSEQPKCFNTTKVMVTVHSLKPFTLYQFKVKALYNSSEWNSPYSETIECYTDEDFPGPVREVQWFLSNITEIRIAWKEPSRLNGIIRSYTVSYTSGPLSTPPNQWKNVTVSGNRTTAMLPGLTPSTRYFVEVRAATNAGYGKSSERIMIQTGNAPKNSTNSLPGKTSPYKPVTDQSLGIIVGVSISTCFIIICLSSIYCRKKWENIQSSRESSQTLKDRIIVRNGNGCCIERNSVPTAQHVPIAAATNEIELAVFFPPSSKSTNSHADMHDHSTSVVESCVKEPLLTQWNINGDNRDLDITENPQFKRRSSTTSDQLPEHELDGTQLTTLNYTVTSSGSSVNNNFEHSDSLTPFQQVPSMAGPVVGPNG